MGISAESLQGLLDKLVSEGKFTHPVEVKFPVMGNMDNKEAESILLYKPLGTWILHYDSKGENEIISVHRPKNVEHMRIMRSEGGVILKNKNIPMPLSELLTSLQENGQFLA